MKIKNLKTLSLGLEHFIDKSGYQSDIYKKNGESIKYVVLDMLGQTDLFRNKYKAQVEIIPPNIIARLFYTIKILASYHPDVVELYCGGRMSMFYAILSKLAGKKLIVFLRGKEFDVNFQTIITNYISLKLADIIIVINKFSIFFPEHSIFVGINKSVLRLSDLQDKIVIMKI